MFVFSFFLFIQLMYESLAEKNSLSQQEIAIKKNELHTVDREFVLNVESFEMKDAYVCVCVYDDFTMPLHTEETTCTHTYAEKQLTSYHYGRQND